MIMPPTKPELPTRRSLPVECFILSCILIINLTYICTIASPMKNIEQSPCLILFSCTTLLHIINLLISQLCYRLTNGRQLHIYYYALQYTLTYFGALIAIYYFSVGALFLFQPRSGQPCRAHAPGLYRTLLVWQWIRVLFPLLVVPLILILCCLEVFFGTILSYCLPASITVPILELIRSLCCSGLAISLTCTNLFKSSSITRQYKCITSCSIRSRTGSIQLNRMCNLSNKIRS
ncbi:unnamed protein product [Rotaria socialis]